MGAPTALSFPPFYCPWFDTNNDWEKKSEKRKQKEKEKDNHKRKNDNKNPRPSNASTGASLFADITLVICRCLSAS